jgi:flagellar biogenesis protein FliO
MIKGNFSGVKSNTVLKPVLLLSAILLILWMFTLSQSDNSEQEIISSEQQARLDSLRVVLGTSESAPQRVEDNLFGNAFPVFLILIAGIGLIWWWNQKKQTPENVLTNVVAEQEIGPAQFIKVVSLGDEYLVLGVTSHQINLLKTISKQDWNPTELQKVKQPTSLFSKMMERAEGKSDA